MTITHSVRRPAVAGQFYTGIPDILEKEVDSLVKGSIVEKNAIGAMMPHAGYIYSGAVAGETVAALDIPEKIIILGPNHTGVGPPVSVFPEGEWVMPFGNIPVDGQLVERIVSGYDKAIRDESAHINEHSIEVQLPFFHYRRPGGISFVPIALSVISTEACMRFGEALARIIDEHDEKILLIASSDMTHFKSHDVAKEKDSLAIERILELDAVGLYETVFSRKISMCGVIPTTVMLHAAKELGAAGAKLVRYSTSGETSGDYDHVVGYAGIIVY